MNVYLLKQNPDFSTLSHSVLCHHLYATSHHMMVLTKLAILTTQL